MAILSAHYGARHDRITPEQLQQHNERALANRQAAGTEG